MLRRSFFATLLAPLIAKFKISPPAVGQVLYSGDQTYARRLADNFFVQTPLFMALDGIYEGGDRISSAIEPQTISDRQAICIPYLEAPVIVSYLKYPIIQNADTLSHRA